MSVGGGASAADDDLTAHHLTARTRRALADAWRVEGALRRPLGGNCAELPGVSVMASGLPFPQWNSGDVHDAGLVDLDQLKEWYAARRHPWGLRVPAGVEWSHGRLLFRQRLMALEASSFVPPPAVPSLELRAAGVADLEMVVRIDAAAFESDPRLQRQWIKPHLSAESVTTGLAIWQGQAVGIGCSLVSRGAAGQATYVSGIAVDAEARGRGIGAAITGWLIAQAIGSGSDYAHLHPDTDLAARLYARLGFIEVGGLDIYVDL